MPQPPLPSEHPTDDHEDRERYEPPTIEDLGTLDELTKGSTGVEQDIVSVQAGQFPSA